MKKVEKTAFSQEKSYKITHTLSKKLLTAGSDGQSVYISAAEKGDSQKWMLKETEKGINIVSKLTGKALDIMLSGTNSGARLHQWEECGAESQFWLAEKVGAGAYKLISAHSGKCADVVDISAEDGAALQLWDDLEGENQLWKIAAVPAPAKKAEKAEEKAQASVKPAEKEVKKEAPKAEKPAAPVAKAVEAPAAKAPAVKAPAKASSAKNIKTASGKKAKK